MSNGHGGARPGAGRKPRVEKFPEVFDALDRRLAEGTPDRLDSLEYLAAGGFPEEDIEEIWEPAGLIYSGSGETRSLAFPDLPAGQMVCIQRKIKRHVVAPDRQANIYLVDRFAGKPVQSTELSGPNGAPIPLDVMDALTRVYGADGDAE